MRGDINGKESERGRRMRDIHHTEHVWNMYE